MDQQTSNCAQCNKPKASSGSITQWVFGGSTCRCDAPVVGSSGSTAVTICPKCRKPEYKGAQDRGSITQWVMRSNSCSCSDSGTNSSSGLFEPDHFKDHESELDPIEINENKSLQPDSNNQDDDSDIEKTFEIKEANEVPVNIGRNFVPLAVLILVFLLFGGTAVMMGGFLDKPAVPEGPAKNYLESESVDEKWDRAVKIMDTSIMPAYSSIALADLKVLRGENELLRSEPDLVLRGTDVTDGELAKLKVCKKLGEVDLSETKVSDAAIPNIVQAKTIKKLLLNGVRLKPQSLEKLDELPMLSELQLDNAGLTDDHLVVLSKLSRLQSLKVSNNPAITNDGVRNLAELTNLSELDLTGIKINANALLPFKDMKGLAIKSVFDSN